MSVAAAISGIRRYQSARSSLSSIFPLPSDYDDRAVALHDTLMADLRVAGFASVPVALAAIAEEYQPGCGDCHKCCADFWPDCEKWDGSECIDSKTPMECMVLCSQCWTAIERNWPEAG